MSKKLSFVVTLTFEDEITSKRDVMEVARNIARAIKNETKTGNIAPGFGYNYTKNIKVKPEFLKQEVTISLE